VRRGRYDPVGAAWLRDRLEIGSVGNWRRESVGHGCQGGRKEAFEVLRECSGQSSVEELVENIAVASDIPVATLRSV
jgi:hypothetical protein